MKKSQSWVNTTYNQNTFSRVSQLPVLAKNGPTRRGGSPQQKNEQGEAFIVAGKSVAGGEEVAG